ncbi:hypothetical protein [Mycobacterium sp. 29Ha]|uniref:hypothetical protein n=1 Tax=Mycobacterium sp. 29Ha TaxID=2939268 RepID=UPI00293940EA|nr:hypothetical protein [Mycobacterium sp. 29Ha]MDV3132967.1 hypothetical protein [Mycobacterium sp. 29Ha]
MIARRSMSTSAVMAVVVTIAIGGSTALASASPDDGSRGAADCQYVLTSPELVIVPGGAKSVRATLTPKTCTPNAQVTGVTVCLSTPVSQGNCKRLPGWATPEIIIPSTSPDATYTATGEVCWQDILGSFRSECRTTEPVTSTL